MLAVLRRSPGFRRMFLAHAASRAGDAFNTVALVVLVFQITGSGAGVAGTVAFEVLPILLLGPVAGVVVDRFSRRRVMIIADLARAALAGSLAVAHTSVAAAYVVAFGLSAGSVLFGPAASAMVPEVVDHDELVDANAALWTVAVAAQIVLAPAAGAVIAGFGIGWAFAANAASFVASALLLAGMPVGRQPSRSKAGDRWGWQAVTAGAALVCADPLLARLALVQMLAALSTGATSGLLVVLAAERLGVGPSGFGTLLAAIGVGAAAGPLVLRHWIRPSDRRWLFGPYALRGAVDVVLATIRNPVAAAGALGAYGIGTSTGMIAYQSTLQSQVPSEVRGRVFTLFDVVWNSARLVSLGTGGLVADALGVRAVYFVGAVLLFAAAAVGWSARAAETTPIAPRLGSSDTAS